MALSKASNTYNRPTWEDSNFPILCQVCLGDNPYVRMMKDKFGSECKICKRPFTIFKWCPGRGMRYKKTEICQTCCKLKNVCQTCLLDLEYGLPVQVRDQALQVKETMPKNQVNREFYLQNVEKEGDGTEPAGELGNIARTSDLLNKLARKTPYYRRNLPHICSFWVKGECKRGEECPYRHEKPTDPDDPLADQNIKDRYFGVNDPVADKIMTRVKAMPQLSLPEDLSVTTLYVGNLGSELGDASVEEKDLRDYFYQFGEVRNITILSSKGCAFVQFTTRRAAELAAERSYNKLIVKGRRLTVRWGRPQSVARGQEGVDSFGRPLAPVPGLPGLLPTPMDFFGLSQQQDVSATKPSQADSAPEAEKQGEESESADVAGPSSKKARAEISSDGGAKPPNPPAPQPPPIRGWPPMPFPMPPGFPPFPVGGYNFARPPLPFSGPPNSAPPVHGFHAPKAIHYPSQDPLHLGARDVQE